MSVLRHGSAFFQRRLTKLYTDTKSSCESVSAARLNDDPELVALNRTFRTQKDRLLAWGLDWSDASAAQPNDIDEALSEAGFGDVVASVMSSIQELLNEAERLQQPDVVKSPDTKGNGPPGSFPSPEVSRKTSWTDAEISRSKVLLEELTSHIDTLYDLSRSRRNMSMNMNSSMQGRPPLTKSEKSSKESFYPARSDSKGYSEKTMLAKQTSKKELPPIPISEQYGADPLLRMPGNTTQSPIADQSLMDHLTSTKEFYIDRSALYLSKGGVTHTPNPPPYEAVAASANSRVTGQLEVTAVPCSLAEGLNCLSVPVLVEFSPILLQIQNSLVLPKKGRLQLICQTLQRLVENARVSHLGLLKFLGYFVDMTYSRYAFVYQMRGDTFPITSQPSNTMQPKPLVSLLHSAEDHHDPVPNLETRFRLAYNLVLAVLHLRSQNIVHGNINSNNILMFPGTEVSNSGNVDTHAADLRHPYLTCLVQIDGETKNAPPEPLSSSMYRHPDDRRNIDDQSAWAYDLYSLGLVLLEIGLWTPISRFWKMKYTNAMFKSRIENVYIKKLAAKCGGAFLQTVQLCLDAPNFHISTSPMADLGLRIPQTYHYPWNEPSKSNEWDTFSKNFLYTVGKILFRCSSLDIFSPPPTEDLEESLPPPLTNELVESPLQEIRPQDAYYQTVEPVPIDVGDEPRALAEPKSYQKSDGGEKKVKKRTVKKWANLEIPDQHLDHWNKAMMPQLSKLLKKILKNSPESCSATLMVAGETAETAKTTICVTCTNVKRVKAALKKYFQYDPENWDLIVIRGDVKRSKVPRRRRRKAKNNKEPAAPETPADPNPHFQQKPLCGASIGAFRQEEHLPPVSYGGAILVDGTPYGMTVHHMLDSPCEDDDDDNGELDYPPRSAGNYTPRIEMLEQDFAYSWCEDAPTETLYPFEISEDEEDDGQSVAQSLDDDYWLSDGYSSDEGDDYGDFDFDDDAASVGDTMGVDPSDEPRIIVTQPAIDDVDENFFPNFEDRDDEHLASHSLGYVHASSGVRRWTRNGIKHEVDWALVKIDAERMDDNNSILTMPPTQTSSTSAQPSEAAITLTKVAKFDELAGLHVQCRGRTSGLQSGRISKALTLVRMHGRQSFSSSYSVDGNFGMPGDSGAWVFDKTGQLCGHVLAWSEKNRTAYIAPMEILLDDIARTLSARSVALPGSDEGVAWATAAAEEQQKQLQHSDTDELFLPPYLSDVPPPPPPKTHLPNMPMPPVIDGRIEMDMVKDHLPLKLSTLNLDLDDASRNRARSPHQTAPGSGASGAGGASTGGMRNIKGPDVSGPTYRGVNMNRLVPHSHPRAMERQLA